MRLVHAERRSGTSRQHRAHPAGFSLIELLVAVVIIGLLAAIAIPNFVHMRQRSSEASVKGNAHSLQLAVEDWSVTHDGALPALADIHAGMFPGGVFPTNPFSGVATIVAAPGYSQGDLGYLRNVGGFTYTIEGYGAEATSGPAGNGTVIWLSNG